MTSTASFRGRSGAISNNRGSSSTPSHQGPSPRATMAPREVRPSAGRPRKAASTSSGCRSRPRPPKGPATSATAVSRNTPVGTPARSRSSEPPAGSEVAGPTPAASKAAVLATATWPQYRYSSSGRSGTAISNSSRVGRRRSARVWSSSRVPIRAAPGGRSAAEPRSRSISWSRSAASFTINRVRAAV